MTSAGLCVLVVLLWTPGNAFEPTDVTPKKAWTCPNVSLATTEPPPLYHTWAAILSCIMLGSAAFLSTFICLFTIHLSRTHFDSITGSQVEWIQLEEVESLAQSLEFLGSPISPLPPDVESPPDDAQERPPSPIVLVHRAQEDSSEDEEAPGTLVHRNVARRPLQPDSEDDPLLPEQ